MKTIRHSTFETNSSSTHAFTIKSKKNTQASKEHLVYAGVIYPHRLKHSTGFTDDIGYGGWSINCVTMHEKLAQFLLHLNYLTEDDYGVDDNASLALSYVSGKVKNELFLDIVFDTSSNNAFTGMTEDGAYLIDLLSKDDWTSAIDAHWNDVIRNNDVITSESDLEN